MIVFAILATLLLSCQSNGAETKKLSDAQATRTPLPKTSVTENVFSIGEDGAETQSVCEESGTIQNLSIHSDALKDTLEFSVYYPPCYHVHPKEPYPVIYLLHGQWQGFDLWQSLGIQAVADDLILNQRRLPFLIIMPHEKYQFRPKENNPFAVAILEDLLPWAQQNLSVCAERACRAIGGISRGAAWAAQLAFQYPGYFVALGTHSISLSDGDRMNISNWVTSMNKDELPRIYADVGSSDPTVKNASTFDQTLNALGVTHEWHLNAGNHNAEYWQQHLADYLRWYTLDWLDTNR